MSGGPEFSLEAQEPPAFGAEERRGACLETSEAGGELERRWGLELLERGSTRRCLRVRGVRCSRGGGVEEVMVGEEVIVVNLS